MFRRFSVAPALAALALVLAACGQAATTTPTAAPAAPAATAAAAPAAPAPTDAPLATSAPAASNATAAAEQVDLTAVRSYLLDKSAALAKSTTELKTISDSYYELAKTENFDYAALWSKKQQETAAIVLNARKAWVVASPLYEQMEGIVAGTPSLADFDVILDAGGAGAEGGDNVVPFDLTLPDGRVLPKPGNLFGVTESTLWGTFPAYVGLAKADVNGDGKQDLGDALPDANVLKGGVDALDKYARDLDTSAQAWQPTEAEAFGALVTMVPTMSEYFESWKNSRFVSGDASTQRDFVAISRLSDINDILGGLQVVYTQLSPKVQQIDAAQNTQINTGMEGLKAFVNDVRTKETSGERFTAEEADTLGAEAQDRATAITGQISQVAAKLNIPLESQ